MILLTGATGLLGSYLARYLVLQSKEVRALKRPTSDLSLLGDAKDYIEWVDGDLLDITSLEEAMDGVDQVYHSAAFISFLPKQKQQMFKINVEGTQNIVNMALDMNVQKLLHVSSIAAIGKGKPETLLTEETAWEESPYDFGYGLSKYLGELEVWRGMVEGLNSVIINPSTIMGAGRWSDSSTKMFQRVNDGLSFYPKGSNGFVDVRDVAQAAIQLMDSNVTNHRFIVSAENLPYRQVLNEIAQCMGKKPPTIPVSGIMNAVGIWVEKIKSSLNGHEPVLTKEIATLTANNYIYNNSKLLDTLDGFQYRPITDTLRETVEAMQASAGTHADYAILDL